MAVPAGPQGDSAIVSVPSQSPVRAYSLRCWSVTFGISMAAPPPLRVLAVCWRATRTQQEAVLASERASQQLGLRLPVRLATARGGKRYSRSAAASGACAG